MTEWFPLQCKSEISVTTTDYRLHCTVSNCQAGFLFVERWSELFIVLLGVSCVSVSAPAN